MKQKVKFINQVLSIALPIIAVTYSLIILLVLGLGNVKAWNSVGVILIGMSVVMTVREGAKNYHNLAVCMALIGTFITGFCSLLQ